MDGTMSFTALKNIEELKCLIVDHGQDLYSAVGKFVFGPESVSTEQWGRDYRGLRDVIKFLMLMKTDAFISDYIKIEGIDLTLDEIYAKIFVKFPFSDTYDYGVETSKICARTFIVYLFGYLNMLKEMDKVE